MKENKYDNEDFFNEYSKMTRSTEGLEGAGEWHEFKKMFPDFEDKKVLDLGCGFGWHCQFAAEQGAKSVIGTDISEKMLKRANEQNKFSNIKYEKIAIEDIFFEENSFDIVISSLAFHYIESFENICKMVRKVLTNRGVFVFSVEHPIFTSHGIQDWYYDEEGNILHWPVDRYFIEGIREANFLGKEVKKYHRTITTYLNTLIKFGFDITNIVEPLADPKMIEKYPEIKNELRRPMFLLVSSVLKK